MVTETKTAQQTIDCGRQIAKTLGGGRLLLTPSMKQRIVLVIDTTGETGLVTVTTAKRNFRKSWPARGKVDQLVTTIEAALKAARAPVSSITEITVNPGPGSFIGSRAGVTVANTLGWVLGIPVNGKRPPIAVQYQEHGSFRTAI